MIAPTTDLIDFVNNCKSKKEKDTFEYIVYTDTVFDIALDVFGTLIKNTYKNN